MKKVTIDGNLIKTKEELHEAFSSQLAFPEWYGKNLDALHDCLTDINEETVIEILSFTLLEETLGKYCQSLIKALNASSKNNPNLKISII